MINKIIVPIKEFNGIQKKLNVKLDPTQLMCLAIVWGFRKTAKQCQMSQEAMAEAIGVSPRTTQRALAELSSLGLIETILRKNNTARRYPTEWMYLAMDELSKTSQSVSPRPDETSGYTSSNKKKKNRSVETASSDCPPEFQAKYLEYQKNFSSEIADMYLALYKETNSRNNI